MLPPERHAHQPRVHGALRGMSAPTGDDVTGVRACPVVPGRDCQEV